MKFENIPQNLKELPRWVCWKLEERKGKSTKIPYNSKPKQDGTYGMAMSNNAETWGSYEQAIQCLENDKAMAGIGFMLGDGFVGVDIDDVQEDGVLAEHARDIIAALDSFTEFSPSGQGLHVICRGKLPEGRRQVYIEREGKPNAHLGIYDERRFFCMTGNILDDAHMDIEERTEQLAVVHEKYINVKKTRKSENKAPVFVPESSKSNGTCHLSDYEIIEKILKEPEGNKFNDLMNGMWKGHFSSQSEADLSICNKFAFYSGGDYNTIDRLYRQTGLMRSKWDEPRPGGTIGSIAINMAIRDCKEFYHPPVQKKPKSKQQDPPEIDLGLEYISDPKLKRFPLNDIGNAEHFVEQYGSSVRYCKSFSCWFIWDEKRWTGDEVDIIYEYARNISRSISIEAYMEPDPDRREAILKHAQRSCSNQSVKAMVEQARSMPGIPITPNQVDSNPWLLNCINGTINLRSCELLPHSRDNLITKLVPFEYDPDAQAPLWDKFLQRIFDGNMSLINFLQRAAGYSLTGDTGEQCLFFCYGTGLNGKSTFLEAIRNVAGDYGCVAATSTFVDRSNQNNSNDIAGLKGMRLATSVEVSNGAQLNEALVKQLTGSDRIKARFLHKEFFEFDPTFKFWLAFNHKPVIRGTDNGIWRRIMLIPFSVQIPDSEKDGQLPQKLKREYPGIFTWMVEGLRMWLQEGLNPPQEVRAATAGYRNEMDLFGDFLSLFCVIDPSAKARSDELYHAYCSYCKENNIAPWPSKRVTLTMRERGFVEEPAAARRIFWKGIGLIQEETGAGQWWNKKDSEDSEDLKFLA